MSSLYYANALFSKYQQAAASCSVVFPNALSAGTFPDSCPTSSCTLASNSTRSGYHHVTNGGNGREFPPCSPSLVSFSRLHGSNGNSIPSILSPSPEMYSIGGEAVSYGQGAGSLSSLHGSLFDRHSDSQQLGSRTASHSDSGFGKQTSSEDYHLLSEDSLRIYPWMRSSGKGSILQPQTTQLNRPMPHGGIMTYFNLERSLSIPVTRIESYTM